MYIYYGKKDIHAIYTINFQLSIFLCEQTSGKWHILTLSVSCSLAHLTLYSHLELHKRVDCIRLPCVYHPIQVSTGQNVLSCYNTCTLSSLVWLEFISAQSCPKLLTKIVKDNFSYLNII